MRYLKITSAENPNNDYIELNNFNGYLCTSFTTLGISRQYETLTIDNRQFSVDNKPKFKDYSLTVHILTKYSLWEQKYRELINFFDRNKKGGFRLYYRPYDDMDMRYILCDIKTSAKTEKMQPVTLTVSQNSLWIGKTKSSNLLSEEIIVNNSFEFKKDEIDDIYCASFKQDNITEKYYCINFTEDYYENSKIVNECYEEIPLQIKIYGYCNNPHICLLSKNKTIIKQIKINIVISENYYVFINSHINENGVWLVNKKTDEKTNISHLIYNEYGSPYWYIGKGTYYVKIVESYNKYNYIVEFNEEYSE